MSHPRWVRIVGFVIHLAIGGLMIMAASGKLMGPDPESAKQFEKYGLTDSVRLIGIGEAVTAILLIVPWTSSLGTLLASSFWGGTICLHMSHHEDYWRQSCFLLATWLGAYLRTPPMFSSFRGRNS
jgi:hypothetical protein